VWQNVTVYVCGGVEPSRECTYGQQFVWRVTASSYLAALLAASALVMTLFCCVSVSQPARSISIYYVHKLDAQRRDSTFAPPPKAAVAYGWGEGGNIESPRLAASF